jgi:hypothetical protein
MLSHQAVSAACANAGREANNVDTAASSARRLTAAPVGDTIFPWDFLRSIVTVSVRLARLDTSASVAGQRLITVSSRFGQTKTIDRSVNTLMVVVDCRGLAVRETLPMALGPI